MSEPKRTQTFPDGTTLPVPVHPRFTKDRLEDVYFWICGNGEEIALGDLRKYGLRPQDTQHRREWQSCCAVAAWCWRKEAKRLCDGPDIPPNARVAYGALDAWVAEFGKADAELRRA